MIGILLILVNNHRKLVDTINNIKYTAHNLNSSKNQNKKYYSDMNGNMFDISTNHMVVSGVDKHTGHRGMIDVETNKLVDDFIEQSITMHTNKYFHDKFPKLKNRLDMRKECLKNNNFGEYYANGKRYIIYWDDEHKHLVDKAIINKSHLSYLVKELLNKGYSSEEVYEYFCWKGEQIEYPLPKYTPTNIFTNIKKGDK